MCDKASFRSGHEPETPKPRSAQELHKAALELQEARKKKFATGTQWQEDYLR